MDPDFAEMGKTPRKTNVEIALHPDLVTMSSLSPEVKIANAKPSLKWEPAFDGLHEHRDPIHFAPVTVSRPQTFNPLLPPFGPIAPNFNRESAKRIMVVCMTFCKAALAPKPNIFRVARLKKIERKFEALGKKAGAFLARAPKNFDNLRMR